MAVFFIDPIWFWVRNPGSQTVPTVIASDSSPDLNIIWNGPSPPVHHPSLDGDFPWNKPSSYWGSPIYPIYRIRHHLYCILPDISSIHSQKSPYIPIDGTPLISNPAWPAQHRSQLQWYRWPWRTKLTRSGRFSANGRWKIVLYPRDGAPKIAKLRCKWFNYSLW